MPKKPVRPLGMTRSNAPVPFLNPFTEKFTRDGENRKLVSALQHVKPAVDNTSPPQYAHLQDNKKKEWLTDSESMLSSTVCTQPCRDCDKLLLSAYSEVCQNRAGKRPSSGTTVLDCKTALPGYQAKDFHVRATASPSCISSEHTAMPSQRLHVASACSNILICRPGIALDHHLRPVIDNVEGNARVPGNSVNCVTKKLERARILADNQQILQRICKSKGQYSGVCAQRRGAERLCHNSC